MLSFLWSSGIAPNPFKNTADRKSIRNKRSLVFISSNPEYLYEVKGKNYFTIKDSESPLLPFSPSTILPLSPSRPLPSEPTFYLLPESLAKKQQADIECYFTNDYQSGNNACNLPFGISQPGYYQNKKPGQAAYYKKDIAKSFEHFRQILFCKQ